MELLAVGGCPHPLDWLAINVCLDNMERKHPDWSVDIEMSFSRASPTMKSAEALGLPRFPSGGSVTRGGGLFERL